jgi:hypothetical protein
MSNRFYPGQEVLAGGEHGRVVEDRGDTVSVMRTVRGYASDFSHHNVSAVEPQDAGKQHGYTVVQLLASGVSRVLYGSVGMTFIVHKFTPSSDPLVDLPVAHIRDYRFPDAHNEFTIWSIPAVGYRIIPALTGK